VADGSRRWELVERRQRRERGKAGRASEVYKGEKPGQAEGKVKW
jgi:hypothetical protein